jgi:hypothetical protein
MITSDRSPLPDRAVLPSPGRRVLLRGGSVLGMDRDLDFAHNTRSPAHADAAVQAFVSTIVLGADTKNVETVFVAGRARKLRGILTGHDVTEVRRLVHESRDDLVSRSGVEVTAMR